MAAVRSLTDAAGKRKLAGMIQEPPAGIHAMRLDGAADTMLIVWTDQPGARRTIEYPTRNLFSATDVTGNPIQSKEKSGGQATAELEEAAGPIYLLWRAEAGERATVNKLPRRIVTYRAFFLFFGFGSSNIANCSLRSLASILTRTTRTRSPMENSRPVRLPTTLRMFSR